MNKCADAGYEYKLELSERPQPTERSRLSEIEQARKTEKDLYAGTVNRERILSFFRAAKKNSLLVGEVLERCQKEDLVPGPSFLKFASTFYDHLRSLCDGVSLHWHVDADEI